MEKAKAQGGKRVIYTQHHACWDAKNRHGLPEELTFNSPEDGWKQIAHCIPGRAACIPGRTAEDVQPVSQRATVKQTEPEAQDLNEVDNEPVKSASQVANEIINELAKPKTEPPKNDLSGVPKALADLMCENKVTVQEIQTACANRGYVTIDTPISNYDPGFIDGCLVGAWPQVFQMICDNRK
jgi:hypothetical protein